MNDTRCAYPLERWARTAREPADRGRRHRIEDPRTARYRYRRSCLPSGCAGGACAHREAAPEHRLAAILAHGAARLPAAARRPLIHRVEHRTRRGGAFARARCSGALAPRSMRRAARCWAASSSRRRSRASRSSCSMRVEYVRPRAVLLGDAAHVVHPLAGQGLESGTAGLRLARRCAGQRPADPSLLGDSGCCGATSAGAKARICSPPPRWMAWSACFRTPIRRLRGCAQRGLGAVGKLPFIKRQLAQRALGLIGECPFLGIELSRQRRSSLAAQMKSFCDRPPIECVVKVTRQ